MWMAQERMPAFIAIVVVVVMEQYHLTFIADCEPLQQMCGWLGRCLANWFRYVWINGAGLNMLGLSSTLIHKVRMNGMRTTEMSMRVF